jgi:hypothetical protein
MSLKTIEKPCVLEDRACTNCGECDRCDLDPNKQCDSCCRCIDTADGDYAEIGIDDILLNNEDLDSTQRSIGKGQKYKIKHN